MKSRMKLALRSLPVAQVQISLPGFLCRAFCATCATPFWGLCIDAGQQVLSAFMKADRVALCGPKGVPDAGRRAVRGGSTASQIVLGGRCIAVRRPRARSRGGGWRTGLAQLRVGSRLRSTGRRHA